MAAITAQGKRISPDAKVNWSLDRSFKQELNGRRFMQSKKPWTIMVYIAADNNLANFGVDSLKQMKTFGGDAVNIVAEFDPGPLQQTKRYVFDGLTSTFSSIRNNQVGVGPAVNPGDADNVESFMDWSYANFPAEHYYLGVWGHGGGVTNDFPRDETFVKRHNLLSLNGVKGTVDGGGKGTVDGGGKRIGFFAPTKIFSEDASTDAFVDRPTNYFKNTAMKTVLAHAKRNLKQKIDVVGMDICNMNMIEVAYELRGVADYLVASQDSVPDASWPYDRLLNELLANPAIQPRNLATLAPRVYKTAYNDYFNEPVTLSALDLGTLINGSSAGNGSGAGNGSTGLTSVSKSFKALTQQLSHLITEKNQRTRRAAIKAIKAARKQVRTFAAGLFIDVVHFCEILESTSFGDHDLETPLIAVVNGLRRAIIANEFSCAQQNCNGTSIFFPDGEFAKQYAHEGFSQFYNKLDFPAETGWGKFLDEFIGTAS